MKSETKFVLFSAGLYLLSLTQADFYDAFSQTSYGYLRVQVPVYMSNFQFGWVANPLLLSTWILTYMGRQAPARICAAVAIACGGIFLFQELIDTGDGDVLRPGAGYLLWIASMIVMAVKATSAHRMKNRVIN